MLWILQHLHELLASADNTLHAQNIIMNTIVLLSGGMDSVTALYWAHKNHKVTAGLSFIYGSKHNHREVPLARWHCQKLGIPHTCLDLDFIPGHFTSDLLISGGEVPDGHYAEQNMKRTVVPFRNGIMLAVATGFAESVHAQGLVIAAHAGDHAIYPDCREEFMASMAEAMRHGTYEKIELLRPFIRFTKADIARAGHDMGIDFSRTWSCYKGGAMHCGTCGTCVERREAFALANLADPTSYISHAELPPAPLDP